MDLPIWANFVDPTDLSHTTTTTFRANGLNLIFKTSTRPSQAALVVTEVEVEAQPTGLGRLRLRLRQRPSLLQLDLHSEHITI